METLLIRTEDAAQTKTIKAILKALNVKVEILSNSISKTEELPSHVSKLLTKSISEADNGQLTPHQDFMEEVKIRFR